MARYVTFDRVSNKVNVYTFANYQSVKLDDDGNLPAAIGFEFPTLEETFSVKDIRDFMLMETTRNANLHRWGGQEVTITSETAFDDMVDKVRVDYLEEREKKRQEIIEAS